MSEIQNCSVFAEILYDGESLEPRHNTLIEIIDGKIASLSDDVPVSSIPADARRAPIVTPGLIDLQVNGAGDTQFNADLSIECLKKMVAASAQGGAAHIFPTFTTAAGESYQDAVKTVITAIKEGVKGIGGIHLEGPFISPERPGIHPLDFIREMTSSDVDYLCEASSKIKILLTVAPERQNPSFVRRLCESGVVVFVGHSNATFEDMLAAADMGVSGVTHLYNGMSQPTARQPGVVGAVFEEPFFYAGIIADGHHVHPANLRMAARVIPDHLCLVSDAMQTMNGTSTSFEFYGRKISLNDGKLTSSDGTLGGAHLTMAEALRNMVKMAKIPLGQSVILATKNPAKASGLDDLYGTLKAGMIASLSLFDQEINSIGIVRDGVFSGGAAQSFVL